MLNAFGLVLSLGLGYLSLMVVYSLIHRRELANILFGPDSPQGGTTSTHLLVRRARLREQAAPPLPNPQGEVFDFNLFTVPAAFGVC